MYRLAFKHEAAEEWVFHQYSDWPIETEQMEDGQTAFVAIQRNDQGKPLEYRILVTKYPGEWKWWKIGKA